MKPSSNRGDIRGRQVGSRAPASATTGTEAGRFGLPGGIPPYLLSPEGLEAPLPEVTELPPEMPVAAKTPATPRPALPRSGPPDRCGPERHGFDPHGLKPRHQPVVALREHRVHGRGQ